MATAHICLGGTIGNFLNQNQVLGMFAKLARPGDTLILGFQLNHNIDFILDKYMNNPLFPGFVLNYLKPDQRAKLNWKLNKQTGVITAVHKDVEVFRTTKYNPDNLRKMVCSQGFKFIYQDIDEYKNCCLQVYKKM